MNIHTERRGDLYIALACLLLSLFTVFYLIPAGVVVPQSVDIRALAPDFWPSLIAYGAVLCSLFLVIEAFVIHKPPGGDDDEDDNMAEYNYARAPAVIRVFILLGMFLAFHASLGFLGMVAASSVMLFVMMLFFGERKFRFILPIALFFPLLVYMFFRYVAGIPMPLGILDGLLGG